MDNNNIIRQLRYILNYSDSKMIEIFGLVNQSISQSQIANWLKKEDDANCEIIPDEALANFLNGLIIEKRGAQEGRKKPIAEKRLNNNIVLRKLKIALQLKDVDMLEILALADMHISKHELSAFFRKSSQSQYMVCKDQIMRRFLFGLQKKLRG